MSSWRGHGPQVENHWFRHVWCTYIHARFEFILLHFRPMLVLEVMEIGLVVNW